MTISLKTINEVDVIVEAMERRYNFFTICKKLNYSVAQTSNLIYSLLVEDKDYILPYCKELGWPQYPMSSGYIYLGGPIRGTDGPVVQGERAGYLKIGDHVLGEKLNWRYHLIYKPIPIKYSQVFFGLIDKNNEFRCVAEHWLSKIDVERGKLDDLSIKHNANTYAIGNHKIALKTGVGYGPCLRKDLKSVTEKW